MMLQLYNYLLVVLYRLEMPCLARQDYTNITPLKTTVGFLVEKDPVDVLPAGSFYLQPRISPYLKRLRLIVDDSYCMNAS
jgi:hypothetical protein